MHLREMARDLQYQILQVIGNDPAFVHNVELLITCQSVDVETAVTFLVEIVDIRFFWHPGALVRWTGLGPRVYQSGYDKRLMATSIKAGTRVLVVLFGSLQKQTTRITRRVFIR